MSTVMDGRGWDRRSVLRAGALLGAAATGLAGTLTSTGPALAAASPVANGPWVVSVGYGVLHIDPDDPEPPRPLLDWGNEATVSADGRYLALVGTANDGTMNLFLIDRVTGQVRQLTGNTTIDGPHYHWPTFSPDGRKIAFVRNYDELCILKLATGELRRALAGVPLHSPSWSPDGTRIVYWYAGTQRPQLRTLTLTGGGVTRIHVQEHPGERFYDPIFTPDSQRVVFVTTRWTPSGGTGQELASVGLDGTGLLRLTTGDRYYMSPVYSPDGRYLAVLSIPPTNPYPDGGNILVMPGDFSDSWWIPGDEYDDSTRLTWAPARPA
ncbi:TolB family protein [Micromonospora rubida]|uniref:TolB family protein n=1 Tax=Micromonospora rubida TaxID=2697657 RepID=A0ABW7SJM4_9ACTN